MTSNQQRVAAVKKKAEERVAKRTQRIKSHNVARENKLRFERKRKRKQVQIDSLKRQGRHVDVAVAKEHYKILTEGYEKSSKSAKAHATLGYGLGAGRGNFKGTLKQTNTPTAATGGDAPDASIPLRRDRPSAPSVSPSSGKKPKSTTPKLGKLTKKQFQNLTKQRGSQADKNWDSYGTDDSKRKKSAGQKIYNDYDKKIKSSQYSYRSHVAAMKRRGKKANASTYAKFKRYNGI